MNTITRALILDRVIGTCAIDPDASIQIIAATNALKRLSQLDGTPLPPYSEADRPYSELQDVGAYVPPLIPYPLHPDGYVVIWGEASTFDAASLTTLIRQRYPGDISLSLLAISAAGEVIGMAETSLPDLAADLDEAADHVFAVLVLVLKPLPPERNLRTLDGLDWVVARLYGPAGCPWDRRQTHQSLRTALLEEAYEVLEALDNDDRIGLREELGDLMLSVLSHSEMARQSGHFRLEDVIEAVALKLIGRHPHVFTDLAVAHEGEIMANWEQIKAAELAAKGRARSSILDGVPASLPALATAQKLGKKAARHGFAWTKLEDIWAKIDEELHELRTASDHSATGEELGDLLFVLTRLADWFHLDAETVLREANLKFRRRIGYLEANAERPLNELSLDELLALWRAAKLQE